MNQISSLPLITINPFLDRFQKIKYLRVTGLQSAEECPSRWAAEVLLTPEEGEVVKGKYARIGTAIHKAIEYWYLNKLRELGNINEYLQSEGVNEEEINNFYLYLASLSHMKISPIELESEFTLNLENIPIPIRGHMDLIGYSEDGVLTILDHKTDRSYNPVLYWRNKLQTQVYSLAARMIHGADKVRFIIGYPNLNNFVVWETTKENDELTLDRLNKIWIDLSTYAELGSFEPRLNGNCRYCSKKESCNVFNQRIINFQKNVDTFLSQENPYERYYKLKMVAKLADDMADELKESLIHEIESFGGETTVNGINYKLNQSKRRNVTAKKVMDLIESIDGAGALPQSHGNFHLLVKEMIDDIFTAKVGGIDKLIKKFPETKILFDSIIEEKLGEKSIEMIQTSNQKKISK